MSNSFLVGQGKLALQIPFSPITDHVDAIRLFADTHLIEDEKVARGMTSPINFMPDENPSFYEKHVAPQEVVHDSKNAILADIPLPKFDKQTQGHFLKLHKVTVEELASSLVVRQTPSAEALFPTVELEIKKEKEEED